MNGKEAEKFYMPTVNFPIGEDSILDDAYYESRTLKGQLNHYLKEKNLKIETLSLRIGAEAKQISRYSTGERNPDRMMVIRLGLGLLLEIEDMNRLLSSAGYADLSSKRKEDAIILGRYDEILNALEGNDKSVDYDFLIDINDVLVDAGCNELFRM